MSADPAVDPEPLPAWTPRFHITAERHWLNDPNGLIQVAGTYHVFFQENPLTPFWGPPHWGHVSSRDLVTWERHERALSPGPGGPDRDGCWSGCARVVDGVPYLYYTGVVGDGDSRVESVCRAAGTPDLRHWTRDPGNPLIPGPPPAAATGYHRDPFLWRDGTGWHLLLASGTAGPGGRGTVLVYDSPDARTWAYGGVFLADPDGGADRATEHWECPQLVRFGDTAVLVVSVQQPGVERPLSHVDYFVGEVSGNRFRARRRGRLEGGDSLYAPAVMVDERGRHLLWGWAQESMDPALQRRLPVAGALTLPRVLTLDGDRLRVDPVPELAGLRAGAPATRVRTDGAAQRLPARQLVLEATLPGAAGGIELELADDPDADRLRVTVDSGGGLEVAVGRRTHHVDTPPAAGDVLTVYLDGSLVEVFHAGRAVTTRWYGTTAGEPVLRVRGPAGCHAALWAVRTQIWTNGAGPAPAA